MDDVDRPLALPGRAGDFFRYHGARAPGVRLFRRLGFRSKALLISLVLLLLAMVLGAAFLSDTQEQIEFIRKERVGIDAMRRLVPVLRAVLETRNATRANLDGHDASQDHASARGWVDKSLYELDQHLCGSGDALALAPRGQASLEACAATSGSKVGVDDKGRTVFGPVTAASLKVLLAVTEDSNLVLDPIWTRSTRA